VAYRDPSQDEPDVVGFGSRRPPRRPWISRALLGVAAVVIASIVAAHVVGERHPAAKGQPPPVTVRRIGHRLLGVTANWELVARGPHYLVTIQPSTGRVVQTAVPPLQSASPDVALLVESHRVIVRSFDEIPGYVVPDGGAAQVLTGPLAASKPGVVLPGPQPGQAWILVDGPTQIPQAIALVNAAGQLTRTTILLPPVGSPAATAIADGRGYVLLMNGSNDLYDAGPTWYRKVDAELVAVGPSRWFGFTCRHNRCRNVTIDAATGALRPLPGPGLPDAFTWPVPGVTSPDGSVAAVPVFGNYGDVTIQLVSLTTGTSTTLPVTMSPYADDQVMVFSPDGRWLFVAAAGGRLIAVSMLTDKVTSLGVSLPLISQVAIGPAPAPTTAP
jgi:hypothetical protein